MKVKIQSLDKLFSEYIRRCAMQRVGGCERCHTSKRSHKELQACHFHSRRHKTTRFDERNAAGLCAGCHLYLDSHPLEKVEWFKNRLGEHEFNKLNWQAQATTKSSPLDTEALRLFYQTKLQEVRNDT